MLLRPILCVSCSGDQLFLAVRAVQKLAGEEELTGMLLTWACIRTQWWDHRIAMPASPEHEKQRSSLELRRMVSAFCGSP